MLRTTSRRPKNSPHGEKAVAHRSTEPEAAERAAYYEAGPLPRDKGEGGPWFAVRLIDQYGDPPGRAPAVLCGAGTAWRSATSSTPR